MGLDGRRMGGGEKKRALYWDDVGDGRSAGSRRGDGDDDEGRKDGKKNSPVPLVKGGIGLSPFLGSVVDSLAEDDFVDLLGGTFIVALSLEAFFHSSATESAYFPIELENITIVSSLNSLNPETFPNIFFLQF